jgi:hypothetical protein
MTKFMRHHLFNQRRSFLFELTMTVMGSGVFYGLEPMRCLRLFLEGVSAFTTEVLLVLADHHEGDELTEVLLVYAHTHLGDRQRLLVLV